MPVSPMENSRIHRLFVENSVRRAERPQEPRMRGRELDLAAATPRPNASHGPISRPTGAYSLMSRSCAGGMRGGDGSMTSPPVTVW